MGALPHPKWQKAEKGENSRNNVGSNKCWVVNHWVCCVPEWVLQDANTGQLINCAHYTHPSILWDKFAMCKQASSAWRGISELFCQKPFADLIKYPKRFTGFSCSPFQPSVSVAADSMKIQVDGSTGLKMEMWPRRPQPHGAQGWDQVRRPNADPGPGRAPSIVLPQISSLDYTAKLHSFLNSSKFLTKDFFFQVWFISKGEKV